jgi:putative transposase
MVVRCIAKVADAYKLDRNSKRSFRQFGSVAYDARILKWRVDHQTVSIWSLAGRVNIRYVCGPRQAELLRTQQGESDLFTAVESFTLQPHVEQRNPRLQTLPTRWAWTSAS